MSNKPLEKIVIVGGGTAGWMTAAALSHYLQKSNCSIELIESDAIGTVGVGEATIPGIREFNQKLNINEAEFMKATNATFKLGIQFENWGKIGDAYIHPFGFYGHDLNNVSFHHYWLKQWQSGNKSPIGEYSFANKLAQDNKFTFPNNDPRSPLSRFFYAFHFDAGLYAKFLRQFSEAKGVIRTEGKVCQVNQSALTGDIESVELDSGQVISGELFVDCSGFRGLLIEDVLNTGYEDWTHWLPCDTAIAIPTSTQSKPLPYTRAIAHTAGWQWQIPLQHRIGNGHVFCSKFISHDDVETTLLNNLPGEALAEPRTLRFKTGRRNLSWNKNCIAVGLSAGFLEPLESTSIHLIQTAILKLIQYFPDQSMCSFNRQAFNQEMSEQFDQVKDFLILHYKATQREDSEFWRYCKNMSIPDSLSHKLNLFGENGHVVECAQEIFVETNWVAVFLGQHIIPKQYHLKVDAIERNQLSSLMNQMQTMVKTVSKSAPYHFETIARYCPSNNTTIKKRLS